MQPTGIASVCLLLLASRAAGHAIGENRGEDYDDSTGIGTDRKRDEAHQPRVLDMESIFAGFAKSMIGRTGSTSSQNQHCINPGVKKRSTGQGFCKMSSLTTLSSPCQFFKMALGLCDLPDILMLSLNMSNVVLMLVLKGLIWGASYMQGNGGKGRKEGPDAAGLTGGGLLQDVVNETDLLLFLGYLVADESGRYDCLNRVACEQPARAESYLKSAEMVWKTAKLLDPVVPVDAKYERMLIKLQEAIEDGRADGDCQAKYKCSEPTSNEDNFNLI
ncbi:uncharacterized protein LOC114129799 isoform X1 [Aphis gossypii]|uniref:Uncharacterized protein n=1 Tax=Aphis gossypii TaxID=80765 RepID=A0A9P0IRB1_APHGO|nr:uncharacterized protein LOC114129799 isoform X1 [Aphis gossypii]CAH1711568.1 unnamed protein product [Aphis gossypii]